MVKTTRHVSRAILAQPALAKPQPTTDDEQHQPESATLGPKQKTGDLGTMTAVVLSCYIWDMAIPLTRIPRFPSMKSSNTFVTCSNSCVFLKLVLQVPSAFCGVKRGQL